VHLEKLRQLIGIDIQGYKDSTNEFSHRPSSFRLAADALLPLQKLTYLSLDNVLLQQRSTEPPLEEYTSKIVKIRKIGTDFRDTNTYEGSSEVLNNLESQLIFISPKESKTNEAIVAYSVYKNLPGNSKTGIEPKAKPPEPKVAVAFTDIPSLLHLRISECNMQDISWDMFHRLQSLKFLLLERNDLLFLPDFVFYATSNLTTLSLSGNRILSLETVGLAGLLSLQKLDMTHNNITHLSELSLPPFPHLKVADFRFNPIETIFPNTFEVMNTTQSLYLGTPLTSLQIFPNSFYGLTSLLNLEITNVRIGFLESPMFKGLLSLKSLVMDGEIKRVSYDAFSEVPNLERLILRKCKIEKISMDAFIGLQSLLELDLSHNRLPYLPPGIFDDQSSLREIYLQHNELTTLPQNLFARTPSKMIRLEGNPWHCSCDMANWNPTKINQVRSYYIPNNATFCQRQYDKGSMCRVTDSGFQVKYIYEKRVSPVCETPKKFHQRNIFEVVRKELRYCSASTIVNPAIKPKNKTVKGNKLSGKLLKSQGKVPLLTKQEKVRKLSKDGGVGTALKEIKETEPAMIEKTTTSPVQKIVETLETTTTSVPEVRTQLEPTTGNHGDSNNTKTKTRQDLVMGNVIQEDTTTVSNDIPLAIPTIQISQLSSTQAYQLNSLKSLKTKSGTTPPPLKSMKRNTLLPPNSPKLISKKAFKLAKLYAAQKTE